jgi:hypothetical protein
MLVFVDESGDTGLKFDAGSSPYFTVSLVIFEDHDDAQAADERISLLKHELGLPKGHEFHFMVSSQRVKRAFFEAVMPYNFFYSGYVINKAELTGGAFDSKSAFYKYVCGMVFENAKPYLDNAIVKIDGSGDQEFKRELQSYLKRRINDRDSTHKYIKKVAIQDSSRNNLVQLADMICGAVARSYKLDSSGKGVKDGEIWRTIIQPREISVKFWPKQKDARSLDHEDHAHP